MLKNIWPIEQVDGGDEPIENGKVIGKVLKSTSPACLFKSILVVWLRAVVGQDRQSTKQQAVDAKRSNVSILVAMPLLKDS
jgi:hypothetical protein